MANNQGFADICRRENYVSRKLRFITPLQGLLVDMKCCQVDFMLLGLTAKAGWKSYFDSSF